MFLPRLVSHHTHKWQTQMQNAVVELSVQNYEEMLRGPQQCFNSAWVISEHRAPGVSTGHKASCEASLDYNIATIQGSTIFRFYMLFQYSIPWPLKGQCSEMDEYFYRRKGRHKEREDSLGIAPATSYHIKFPTGS